MAVGLLILAFLALWAGATLLLSFIPWVRRGRRRSLADRLRPFSPEGELGGVDDVQRWLDQQ